MDNKHGFEAQWQQLEAELRAYRDLRKQAWGDIDDVTVARYVLGRCKDSHEEEHVRLAMANLPEVRETVEVLQDVVSISDLIEPEKPLSTSAADAVSLLRQCWDRTTSLQKSWQWCAALLNVSEPLVVALERALAQPVESIRRAVHDVIVSEDRLCTVVAGEGDDDPVTTSPLWFTRLLESPTELRWHSPAETEPWHVRIWSPEGGQILVQEVNASEIALSQDVRSKLPKGVDVRWEVRRLPDAPWGTTYVRGVFFILKEEKAAAFRTRQRILTMASDGLNRELGLAGCYFDARLFHMLVPHLQSLQKEHATGVNGCLICRALSSVYLAVHRELTGQRRLGEPEGLWAIQQSNHYLESAYRFIGIQYLDAEV